MVQVIGWTASSRNENPDHCLLSRFHKLFPFVHEEDNLQDYPMKRSGHRCFTDNDYFYVIGGYTNDFHGGAIFKEIWAMSLASFEWRRYTIEGNFPDRLASFSIVQLSPFSKSFLLFGGSGTTFGVSSSNDLYLMTVKNESCTVHSRLVKKVGGDENIPIPLYGQAMCRAETPGKFYTIGGTEGAFFHFDVHSITLEQNSEEDNEVVARFELVAKNTDMEGRYRLEATCDEKRNLLWLFGGGDGHQTFSLKIIPTLDLKSGRTNMVLTIEDPVHGRPRSRRCHSLVRHGRNVIVVGGVCRVNPTRMSTLDEVWILNLDTIRWKKLDERLPEPTLFHDSVITRDGWVLTFGGVAGVNPNAPRNNHMYGRWFDVPSLKRLTMESVRAKYPQLFTGLYGGNFNLNGPIQVINAVLNPETVEENERKIIREQGIRFREDAQRRRYYQNDLNTDFAFTHGNNGIVPARQRPADEQPPLQQRRRMEEGENNIRRLREEALRIVPRAPNLEQIVQHLAGMRGPDLRRPNDMEELENRLEGDLPVLDALRLALEGRGVVWRDGRPVMLRDRDNVDVGVQAEAEDVEMQENNNDDDN